MFPIHNCRPARMQPGRGVRALSLLSVSLLPPLTNPSTPPPLLCFPPVPLPSPPSHPLCVRRIFHFNISIFMPHLRKFKVTVRRHNFLLPPHRQHKILPRGQAGGGWIPSPPLVSNDRKTEENPESGSQIHRQTAVTSSKYNRFF